LARERIVAGGGATILELAGGEANAVTGEHVEQAAHQGDADALALLAQYSDNVSLGLASLANVLDPELIVIAGGLVELGSLLFDPLQRSFMQHIEGAAYRPNIPIVPAQLGERAGAVGAAVLARELLT
jgi:glucokinase